MNHQEFFLDTLREDYSEEVTEIINNSQFIGKTYLDLESLNDQLKRLKIAGYPTSLSADDWYELIFEFAPDIYDDLSYGLAA